MTELRRFTAVFGFLAALLVLLAARSFAEEKAAAPNSAEQLIVDKDADVSAGTSMVERLKVTGKTGIALLLVSIVSLAFVLERLFHLRRKRIAPLGLAEQARELWSQAKYDEISALCERYPSTLGRIIQMFLERRSVSASDISTLAGDLAGREMKKHLLRAYPMAAAATLGPLLGLYGTVWGMIGAFEAVALAGEMGDPSIMAEDISYALMTTAIGLVIAVPSLAAYHFFRTRTSTLALTLEEEASKLISDWFIGREKDNAN